MLQHLPDEKGKSNKVLTEKVLDHDNWTKIVSVLNEVCLELIDERKSNLSDLLL